MKNTLFRSLGLWIDAALRHRVWVLMAVVLVTAVMGGLASRIEGTVPLGSRWHAVHGLTALSVSIFTPLFV